MESRRCTHTDIEAQEGHRLAGAAKRGGGNAHHVLLGRQVFHRALRELGVVADVVPLAVLVERAEVVHRNVREHAAHIALKPPVRSTRMLH